MISDRWRIVLAGAAFCVAVSGLVALALYPNAGRKPPSHALTDEELLRENGVSFADLIPKKPIGKWREPLAYENYKTFPDLQRAWIRNVRICDADFQNHWLTTNVARVHCIWDFYPVALTAAGGAGAQLAVGEYVRELLDVASQQDAGTITAAQAEQEIAAYNTEMNKAIAEGAQQRDREHSYQYLYVPQALPPTTDCEFTPPVMSPDPYTEGPLMPGNIHCW